MEEYIVQPHPTNPHRTIMFFLNSYMKMAAKNEAHEDSVSITPFKDFFIGTFLTEDGTVNVHFCVKSTEDDRKLIWNDELILNAVLAYNEYKQVGILQTLIETLPQRMMFELQRQALNNVA